MEGLAGQKFHRLTALQFIGKRKLGKRYYPFWLFKCDCGKEKIINQSSVSKGQTKSCGCLQKENVPRLAYKEGSLNTLIYVYKSNAKKRKLSFELTKEEFRKITSENCFYCGATPTKEFKRPSSSNRHYGDYVYNGIDRVDNEKGYIKTNCVSCCETCNRAKLEMDKNTFLNWVKQVYNYHFGE